MGHVKRKLSLKDRETIFGVSDICPIAEQAKKSSRFFVKSQDHLAFDTSKATGHRLTAYETLSNFGEQKLVEILDHGSAVLVSDSKVNGQQPGKRIREWREHLGISHPALAKRTGVSTSEISKLEQGLSRIPAKSLTKICKALSLNEYKVGLEEISSQEFSRGYRFKQLQSNGNESGQRLTTSSALSLLEDAWLISKQNDLRKMLGHKFDHRSQFSPDPDYGDRHKPAWKIGYELAIRTRQILKIPADEPIDNLRMLVEEKLQLPLIQDELSPGISGATVQLGQDRGIVINNKAKNFNIWSARLTIAHELGHLLWDPDQELKTLIVDRNEAFTKAPWSAQNNYVEQRANAFAVEFLAPQSAIKSHFHHKDLHQIIFTTI